LCAEQAGAPRAEGPEVGPQGAGHAEGRQRGAGGAFSVGRWLVCFGFGLVCFALLCFALFGLVAWVGLGLGCVDGASSSGLQAGSADPRGRHPPKQAGPAQTPQTSPRQRPPGRGPALPHSNLCGLRPPPRPAGRPVALARPLTRRGAAPASARTEGW
jgi:hypothetical protein